MNRSIWPMVLIVGAAGLVAALLLVPRGRLLAPSDRAAVDAAETVSPAAGSPEDAEFPWEEEPGFRESVIALLAAGREAGLRDRPIGEGVAWMAERFVGTPYEPGTLDPPGPERLILRLDLLDCVTLVENAVVLATLVKTLPTAEMGDPDRVASAYRGELVRLRYRDGRLDGYLSRLHYFSEWLADNEARGRLEVVTSRLPGALLDLRPLDFMSRHVESYPALVAHPELIPELRAMEAALSEPRWHVPEMEVGAAADGIRTGDILAMKSTLPGLDIAHTGIAIQREEGLFLLHAPLVGDSVEISAEPLPARLLRIGSQDGLLVGRLREPRDGTEGSEPGAEGVAAGGIAFPTGSDTLVWEMEAVHMLSGECLPVEGGGCPSFQLKAPAVRFPATERAGEERYDAWLREVEGDVGSSGFPGGEVGAPTEGRSRRERLLEQGERLIASHDAFIAEFPDAAGRGWWIEGGTELVRNTPGVAVFRFFSFTYFGGAHPNSETAYLNLDRSSGERIGWETLLAEGGRSGFLAEAEKAFRRERGLSATSSLTEGGLFEEDLPLSGQFAILEDGILLHYNPYEVAPYVMGATLLLVEWDAARSFLRPEVAAAFAP